MEPVAATDVEDLCVRGKLAGGGEQAARLESSTHLVDEAELFFGEHERVVRVRVDRLHLGAGRPRVEVDDTALLASHRQEAVG